MELIELVKRAQAGDTEAQGALYEKTYKRVYYLALRLTGNPEDARDAAQDAFLSAFKALPNLRQPNAFEGWLFQITANKCRNRAARVHDDEALPEGFEEYEPDPQEDLIPEDALQSAEKRQIILKIIDDLPELQRECVMLFYYSELSVKQIAETLSCSEGTVKSRLNYARQKLKEGILETEKRDDIRLHTFIPFGLFLTKDFVLSMAGVTTAAVGGAGTAAAQTAAVAAKTSFWTAAKVKIAAVVTAGAVAVTGAGTFLALQPKPLHFEDTVVEAQLRLYLDKPEGTITEKDVAGIERISIAESHWFINDMNVAYFGNENNYYGQYDQHGRYSVSDSDGTFYVEGTETQEIVDQAPDLGAVTTYRDLAQLPALRTLALSKEPVRDLSFLGELPALERLTLAAIPEESLATLPACPQLEFLSLIGLSASTPISLRGSPLVGLHFYAYTDGSPMAPPDLTSQDRLRDYNYNLFLYEGGDEQYPAIELGDLREAPHLTYLRMISGENQSGVIKLLPELTELRGLELSTLTESDLDLLAELPKLEVLSGAIGQDAAEAALRLDSAPAMRCLWLYIEDVGYLQTPRCGNEESDFFKIREEIDQQIHDEAGLKP